MTIFSKVYLLLISRIIIWYSISEKSSPDIEEYQLIRLVNETSETKYKERILDTDCSVLDTYDTCESYFSSFMNIFKSIYDESFPV